MNMKSFLLIFAILLGPVCSRAQNTADMTVILQKCIDLPELQKYYPVDNAGIPEQLCILQHGVSFPINIKVSKFGKPILFMDKKQLHDNEDTSYLLFWTFKTDQNFAQVDFTYHFISADNLPQRQKVNLELQKTNETWTVSKTKIEDR